MAQLAKCSLHTHEDLSLIPSAGERINLAQLWCLWRHGRGLLGLDTQRNPLAFTHSHTLLLGPHEQTH